MIMNEYIPNYGKQEGFAFTRTQDFSQIHGRRRTFGQGESHQFILTEIAEKKLE